MKQLSKHISNYSLFFITLSLIITAGFFYLLFVGKAGSFISLNSYHPFWLNVFFINYTFLGDGLFAIALIGIFLFYFKKRKEGVAFLYSFLLSGIIVQVIKNLVRAPRPKLFFEPGQYLFFIKDVSLANNSSFPSGHTASAFAIATVLILLMNQSKWQLPVLAAAVLVGYSRIYLAQHFLMDVLIGAIIGTLSGITAYYFAYNMKSSWLSFKKMHRLEDSVDASSTGSIQPV